ncbi:MAG: DUF6287 domain-containing protein [Liquorilactobacillus satsumensis]|uniref:DUF6287 domain-containing protein n=1 Tax=Liquorilactobacillus satsumensis TaxID=259059 RepID=UPI0039E8592A
MNSRNSSNLSTRRNNSQLTLRQKLLKLIEMIVTMLFLTTGLVACGSNQAKSQEGKASSDSSVTSRTKSSNAYQNLTKSKAKQVKKADNAVSKSVNVAIVAKSNSDKKTNNPTIRATKAIKEIRGTDKNTKLIRKSYMAIVGVVKNPSLINMQTARSYIAQVNDSLLAKEMNNKYKKKMARIVAANTSMDESEVLNKTQPLSNKKLKAAQEKLASSQNTNQTNSPQANSSTASSAQPTTAKEMNFSQIQQGDYESLLGTWQEAAVSVNRQDGTGSHWDVPQGDTLTVSKDKLVNGTLSLQGNILNDGTNNNDVVFSQTNGYLTADLVDESVAINYSIYFYPKGISMSDFDKNIPTTVDNSKNRIIIWTSNNSYTEVFQSMTN